MVATASPELALSLALLAQGPASRLHTKEGTYGERPTRTLHSAATGDARRRLTSGPRHAAGGQSERRKSRSPRQELPAAATASSGRRTNSSWARVQDELERGTGARPSFERPGGPRALAASRLSSRKPPLMRHPSLRAIPRWDAGVTEMGGTRALGLARSCVAYYKLTELARLGTVCAAGSIAFCYESLSLKRDF